MLRHRVTVITLCPLGEPEIAIGLEPRIEPWLPRNRIACQVSRAGGRCHYSKMNRGNGRAIQRKTSRAIESHLQTVGWISRQKISRLPAEGEAFLLTSPFIELAISECDESGPLAALSMQTSRMDFAVSLILREGCAIHRPSCVDSWHLAMILASEHATAPGQSHIAARNPAPTICRHRCWQ